MGENKVNGSGEGAIRLASHLARWLLLLFVFSLAFMQPPVPLFGFVAVPSDFVFLALAAVVAVRWLAGGEAVAFDSAYWFLGAYFLAMLASAAAANAPLASAAKLLTQVYLLSLPVVCCTLIRSEEALRAVVLAWILGAAVVGAVGLASLALFAVDPGHPWLEHTLFYFGTLPPGDYPRLRLTFLNGNLACNYLSVSMMLVLAARRAGWLGKRPFHLLLTVLLLSAAATISPGIGGIFLGLTLWLWLVSRRQCPRVSPLVLLCGIVVSLLFVAAMAVTPILHPTAPFLIHVPGTALTLTPSARLMIWMEAMRNFVAEPWLGRGIGAEVVHVRYVDPGGNLQLLTDAHNMFLNIAVQCGVVGLAALLALIGHASLRVRPLRPPSSAAEWTRVAAGFALLIGLVYQGLGGSFEDARHLWAALGLLIASDRVGRAAADRAAPSRPGTT